MTECIKSIVLFSSSPPDVLHTRHPQALRSINQALLLTASVYPYWTSNIPNHILHWKIYNPPRGRFELNFGQLEECLCYITNQIFLRMWRDAISSDLYLYPHGMVRWHRERERILVPVRWGLKVGSSYGRIEMRFCKQCKVTNFCVRASHGGESPGPYWYEA